MPPPLSPRYRPAVLWQDQAPPARLVPAPLPAETDVAVIGGGYCGMAAGRALAAAGRSVVVLEADPIGTGASTRNGGMVIPELKAGPAALEAQYGPLGRRLYRAVNEAFDWTEELIDAESIDCDYRRTGQLYLAHHDRLLPSLRAMADEHQAQGEDVQFVEGERLADEIGSTRYPGGVVIERTGGLHPARYHRALTRLALDAGVSVHDRTAVRAVDRRPGGGFDLTTSRGVLACRDVIAATNAYADAAVPSLRRRILPVGSYIIATEPLDAALARDISPKGRMFVDTKNFLFYWRLTPDGRLLFGGRKSLVPPSLEQARDFLHAAMTRVHPQLAGTSIDRAWGGSVAITLDRMPHIGHADGVLYATGCNGSGVALNTWMGMRLAAMLDGGEAPPFAELRHRPIPARPLRSLYLPIVGSWLRWQDR